MFKKSILMQSMVVALVAPSAVLAEVTATLELKNETAVYSVSKQNIGQATSTNDRHKESAGDAMKFENQAKLFINGDIGESSSWHAELKLIYDHVAVGQKDRDWSWKGHENFSQHDYLRELYVDTEAGDWSLRLGKQQQVWGTADGIKLLDIINPTDWREWAQNDMEASRIPVFMMAAERNFDNGGNAQFIISQAESSKIAGLSSIEDGETRDSNSLFTMGTPVSDTTVGVDAGHAFIMKGVDSISGGVNGFMNIGSVFGPVTDLFYDGAKNGLGSFTDPFGGLNPNNPEAFTVGAFTQIPSGFTPCGPGATGAECLEIFTEGVNGHVTNLIDVDIYEADGVTIDPTKLGNSTGWDTSNPDSMWEYMPNATFATFNAFVGMTTKYERDYEDDIDANFGARYRDSLDNGLNWGVNYLYAYDPNPVVNIHWADQSGQKLVVNEYATVAGTTVQQLSNAAGTQFYGASSVTYDPANYGGAAPTSVNAGNWGGPATLTFVESLERVHNLGASFDYATSAGDTPLVLRGEFLYQQDVFQPVIDLEALGRGNLTEALQTEEQDFFKYVIGADITVMTNLLVSAQFIQAINLDYIEQNKTCTYYDPFANPFTYDCSRYTADPSTMHLTNGFQKGWETKEFVSLFLSKPIGEEQLGRWNNIIMWEEGDGWWNRLNADYSITDQFIVSGEWNHYWGDENTTFGQFEASSNVQVGFRYIFEEL